MRQCKNMPYHVGLVLRIYPSREQKRLIAVNDGCFRAVYNRLVALNNERHMLSKTVKFVPIYMERIAYIDSVLRNPDRSLAMGLKNMMPFLNGKDTRIGTITIRKDTIGRYFVSLQTSGEEPFAESVEPTGALVGLDLNVENFLWDSDNRRIENPKFRRNEQSRIAELQKALSRKRERAKKDGRPLWECRNYQKDRIALARLLMRISARGKDFRHVVSKDYVENQDYIFAEDLKVGNLLKNHKLAFAISECGWYDFLQKLEYKSKMYGKVFLRVPPHHTTQTCSECGHVMRGGDKLVLGDREWRCPQCGTYHVRDYNAAKNILAKGIASLSSIGT